MAKPRLHVELRVDTEQHAQAILTGIEQQLAGRAVFAEDAHAEGLRAEGAGRRLTHQTRFDSAADRDAVAQAVLTRLERNPEWASWLLPGSRVTRHLCSHDDLRPTPCAEEVLWSN